MEKMENTKMLQIRVDADELFQFSLDSMEIGRRRGRKVSDSERIRSLIRKENKRVAADKARAAAKKTTPKNTNKKAGK